jgi:DNA polymerase III sliding clamp (beta) subunit (PCNA family)
MEMKTEPLLQALNLARPALGSNDSMPVLSHFCFIGDAIFAFNDVLAIVVEYDSGLHCALHGDTLLGLLNAGPGPDVEIKIDKSGIAKLKMAKGTADLPTLDVASSPFAYPEEDKPLVTVPLTEAFLVALNMVLLSVGVDSVKPEFAGVTVDVQKSGITLYSTDNRSATRVTVGGKFLSRTGATAVLPAQACELLLKLAPQAGKEGAQLALLGPAAVVTFGDVTLVTRAVSGDEAAKHYETVFAEHTTKGVLVDLPEDFNFAIHKACVVTQSDAVRECAILTDGDQLVIHAQGAVGKFREALKLPKKFGPVEVRVDPVLAQRALPYARQARFNHGRSLVLLHADITHVISSGAVEDKTKGKGAEDDIPF